MMLINDYATKLDPYYWQDL